jgi:DNA-binding response OmpR family regulator
MLRLSLLERAILVVEDEPLVAFDIATEFEKRGARVSIAHTLKEALASVEADGLSAAVLDHALPDGDSTQLCERLTKRGIPFVTYSGYTRADVAGRTGVLVEKPAPVSILVATVLGLLSAGISAGSAAAGPLANGHADAGK